jgi:hypothetical protein
MKRALTFLAITGLSLASKSHYKPSFPSDNKPVQVPYGAMDDDEFRVVSHPRYSNEAIIIKPFDNKPVQVPYGAMDDDEFRAVSHPKYSKPSPVDNGKPVQVPYGAMDDDNEFYSQSKKTKEPVLGGKPVETPYLQNQKKFEYTQFPQPKPIEGKPAEVPYGALDDEIYDSHIKKPILGGKPSLRPYLENQKKFERVQFPQPVPVEVPYGALGI